MLNERCDIINNTISPTPVITDDSNPNDTTEREEGGNDIDFEYSNGAYEDNSISERIIENNEKSNDINVDYYSDDTDENENCMYFDDSESEDDTDVRNPYLL